MGKERSNIHTIDTRFTWSGSKAKEFIELAKQEYGGLIPYGGIRHLIRFACIKFIEARGKEE